jgi:haloacetate dehalogenase
MFEGFESKQITTQDTTIHLRQGGSGPPLLLLHGYPQCHVMWHKIAPRLAQAFTVVAPDLRGYGDSGKPQGDPAHSRYSKRAMAQDQVEVMQQLGFETFYLVGHDRGARVSHRLTLDHPQRVHKLAVLDIIPTHRMFQIVNQEMATATYHWFFLIQPDDFPERVIGADPEYFLRYRFERMNNYREIFPPEVLDEYVRCFSDPGTIHATCEDYRAGASIDLVHDEADFGTRQVTCPLFALWSETGYVGRHYNPTEVWRDYATDVCGLSLPCGHYLPEEMPDETYTALRGFLLDDAR